MAKPIKKLTAAQRAAKKQRKKDFEIVFMNGKQVRVRRQPSIDGMNQEEFIRRNADPIWLHQNGDHEILHEQSMKQEHKDARLVDVTTYESMESRIQLLEGIAKGEKAVFEGRVISHEVAKNRMSQWLD